MEDRQHRGGMESPSVAAAAAAAASATPTPLSTPSDLEWFTPLLCLIRSQIEVFRATPADVEAKSRRGGGGQRTGTTVAPGRAGLRCRHCATIPVERRARGSVTYPSSMRLVYQAVRNYKRFHFPDCRFVPEEVRDRAEELGGTSRSSRGTKGLRRWIEACEGIGLVDTDEENGIWFREDARRMGFIDGAATDAALDRAPGSLDDAGSTTRSTAAAEEVAARGSSAHGVSDPQDPSPPTPTPTHSQAAAVTADAVGSGMFVSTAPSASGGSTNANHLSTTTDDVDASTAAAGAAVGSDRLGPSALKSRVALAYDIVRTVREMRRLPPDLDAPKASPSARSEATSKDDESGSDARVDVDDQAENSDDGDDDLFGLGVELYGLFADQDPFEWKEKVGGSGHCGAEAGAIDIDKDIDGANAISNSPDNVLSTGFDFTDLMAGLDDAVVTDDDNVSGRSNGIERVRGDARKESLVEDEAEQQPKKKEPRKSTTHREYMYVPLRDLGFPVSLCVLVSSLLNTRDHDAVDIYQTTEEVENDLRLMVANPERYLFDAGTDMLSGQLVFPPGKLYGRENAISRLTSVFDHVAGSDNPSEIVLISGHAGTGKSVLVDQIRKPLKERNGHFISGKFDELGQAQPMSVIFTAFDDFCGNLLEGSEDQISQIRKAVAAALGSNFNVLTGLIPILGTVMGDYAPSLIHIGGREALNRFLLHFRLFVRAIASPSHPVILFLDDLQWADKSSLELITTLVSDRESRSLLFVGSYRNNEVGLDHPLYNEKRNMICAGVNITDIELDDIDKESVNTLISDAARLSPRLTRSLANVVHAKTSGNPLFVVQFLRLLCEDHLLQYSARSRRWEWDVEAIQSKELFDNVVGLIIEKMLRLDSGVQNFLKESACLGSRSEVATLKLLSSDEDKNGSGIMLILDVAVSQGLLCQIGSSYKFSHDRIQQAAYSLIPISEREAWHLRIGRLLWRRSSEVELKRIIFIVVDQLCRGSNLISDHDEKVEVAKLCLLAGKKASSSSACLQSSIYLLQGTTLLDESDWENHYELSLELFSNCAEAQYITGNHKGVIIASDPIMKHGRSLQDKVGVYSTLLSSLGFQGKQLDAINVGLEVVVQLGQSFPSDISRSDIMNDFAKTRGMLEGTSTDDILKMKVMEEGKMVASMKLLFTMMRYAYQRNQQLMSLIIFRMVQLTLCHGICRESAPAFASFGAILCTFDELEQGYRYGKLALSLLDHFKSKEYEARVYCLMYSMIAIFTEPLQAVLPSLEHGFEAGMLMGDIEWAMSSAARRTTIALDCGINLATQAEEARAYIQKMKDYKNPMLSVTLPFYQTILNLMDRSEDPTVLTGKAMNQEEFMNSLIEKQQLFLVSVVCFLRMWLAYLFRRYDVATEMAKRHQEVSAARPMRLETVINETFYFGLIAATMERKGEEGDWGQIALDAAEKMKAWAANSSWNFQHKVHLLNAEIAYFNGDLDGAAKAYDDAIYVAGEHDFVHDQALACERAGIFHSAKTSPMMGTTYFRQSHKYYVYWGAKRKADDLLILLDDK